MQGRAAVAEHVGPGGRFVVEGVEAPQVHDAAAASVPAERVAQQALERGGRARVEVAGPLVHGDDGVAPALENGTHPLAHARPVGQEQPRSVARRIIGDLEHTRVGAPFQAEARRPAPRGRAPRPGAQPDDLDAGTTVAVAQRDGAEDVAVLPLGMRVAPHLLQPLRLVDTQPLEGDRYRGPRRGRDDLEARVQDGRMQAVRVGFGGHGRRRLDNGRGPPGRASERAHPLKARPVGEPALGERRVESLRRSLIATVGLGGRASQRPLSHSEIDLAGRVQGPRAVVVLGGAGDAKARRVGRRRRQHELQEASPPRLEVQGRDEGDIPQPAGPPAEHCPARGEGHLEEGRGRHDGRVVDAVVGQVRHIFEAQGRLPVARRRIDR